MATDVEVREKRHREIPLCVNRNTARYVAGGCAEKNRKQEIGADENEIPIRLPKAIVDVSADFERDTAQNQTPQNQKKREVITGERRSYQAREDRDQCSAETEEPYLMPCPQRPDRSDDLSAFFRSLGDEPVKHSGAEVPAVQNNVDNQREADDRVPNRDHTNTASRSGSEIIVATAGSFGPFPISRPVRPRKSRPITKYNPVNPIRVKIASPLLTTLL